MLTDGAVNNTAEVVQLIDILALKTNSRVHTLGVGSGASTELVKECANAGAGSYHFIANAAEIEERVIVALQKNYSPMLRVHNIRALDSKGAYIDNLFDDYEEQLVAHKNLRSGKEMNFGIVTNDPRFKDISNLIFEVLNPNTGIFQVDIVPVSSFANESDNMLIGQICAKHMLNERKCNTETKIELSKKFNVLHPLTSMVAKFKFGNEKMQ